MNWSVVVLTSYVYTSKYYLGIFALYLDLIGFYHSESCQVHLCLVSPLSSTPYLMVILAPGAIGWMTLSLKIKYRIQDT